MLSRDNNWQTLLTFFSPLTFAHLSPKFLHIRQEIAVLQLASRGNRPNWLQTSLTKWLAFIGFSKVFGLPWHLYINLFGIAFRETPHKNFLDGYHLYLEYVKSLVKNYRCLSLSWNKLATNCLVGWKVIVHNILWEAYLWADYLSSVLLIAPKIVLHPVTGKTVSAPKGM